MRLNRCCRSGIKPLIKKKTGMRKPCAAIKKSDMTPLDASPMVESCTIQASGMNASAAWRPTPMSIAKARRASKSWRRGLELGAGDSSVMRQVKKLLHNRLPISSTIDQTANTIYASPTRAVNDV